MFKQPRIMGILNVTPDSFSDGGDFSKSRAAIAHAKRMIAAGADIIDIGGESTRPGADDVSVQTELERVLPVIEALVKHLEKTKSSARISIDTRKPKVARAAVKAGAHIWNDVTALTYMTESAEVAAELGCPVILMHALGSPKTMQDNPSYEDVIGEIKLWLATRIAAAIAAGVKPEHITIDPGIGFGKRLEDNLDILRHFEDLCELGYPLLLGASRKSFIGKIDGSDADARLGGSVATAIWAAQNAVDIIRVHDVTETLQALKVWGAIVGD